ncbi:MAG: hypothetical protein DMF66_00990 [Acidobacteria bacterium]|nr:MAG: hypothetical protein DMF66_00990 [Acidobacteriota bacterium]
MESSAGLSSAGKLAACAVGVAAACVAAWLVGVVVVAQAQAAASRSASAKREKERLFIVGLASLRKRNGRRREFRRAGRRSQMRGCIPACVRYNLGCERTPARRREVKFFPESLGVATPRARRTRLCEPSKSRTF